jgi:hypothetical protein
VSDDVSDGYGALRGSGELAEAESALKSVLGLGPLAAAQARLSQAKKQMSEPERAATRTRKELRAQLAHIDDARAVRAAALLETSSPDLAAIAALIQGTDDAHEVAALRGLQGLPIPDRATVALATARVRAAADGVAAAATAEGRAADTTGSLLQAALHHYTEAGDGPCSVCASGRPDSGWRAQTLARAAELDASAARLRNAVTELKRAELDARRLATPVPAALAHLQ